MRGRIIAVRRLRIWEWVPTDEGTPSAREGKAPKVGVSQ